MIFFISPYILKSELPGYLVKFKLFKLIVLLFLSFSVLATYFMVYARVNNFLNDFNKAELLNPYLTYLFILVFIVQVFLSIYSYFSTPNINEINTKLAGVKSNELVNATKFVKIKYEFLVFALLGIQVAIIVQNLIIPIYKVAESF